jgi:DNA-binding transcriptional LysR family regulator
MELRHLRYFVAVAEELHFRRAAERLHVAQPAVSEQVRKLEAELGVQLFHRTQRSVSLTPAGTAMLDEARRVLRQADVACQAARGASERATHRLRLGYLPDSLPARISRALREVAKSVQNVHVDLHTDSAPRLVEDIRAGRLDAVVTSLPAPTNGLRVTPLGAQRAVVVLPATHPLAVDAEIALERLAPERLVVLPREANPAFRNAVAAMCHDAGLSPVCSSTSPSCAWSMRCSRWPPARGPAILPEAVTERYANPGVRFVPLARAEPAFQTALLTDRDNSSIVVVALLRALTRTTRTDVDAPRRALALVA